MTAAKVVLVVLAFCLVSSLASTSASQPKTLKASNVLYKLAQAYYGVPQLEPRLQAGITCVACTLAVALIEQLSQVHNESVDTTVAKICSYLPTIAQAPCQELVNEYGPAIILLIDDEETPDVVCQQINLCENKTCALFPKGLKKYDPTAKNSCAETKRVNEWYDMLERKQGGDGNKKASSSSSSSFSQILEEKAKHMNGKQFDPWQWLIQLITQAVNSHKPIFDIDGDDFSNIETLRGSFWRGKDCDDGNALIYPGRKVTNLPPSVDHNCNGIYGVDSQGRSYEDLLCSGTQQYGVIVLGDSAGAHFHVPPSFVMAERINETTYSDLVDILSMEFDWPEMSSGTGYMNNTWVGHPKGGVASGYLNMSQRNLCMHRDYQNICLNGARTSSMASTIVKTMARNQTTDFPVMITYALIGNDVCNGHPGTQSMTTPHEFYENVVSALDYLDTQLPKGSHLVFIGLVDGRILYDSMANRIHPIGALRQDVTYAQFYDYLNCLLISPCFGWMNSNAYWRNATTQRAMELNQVYKEIIANHTYKNFDMIYFDPPLKPVIEEWTKRGGEAWQLIEPVDGFHPNQIANVLFANYQNNLYAKKYPYLLPPINPQNARIQQIFGNQGGY